VNISILAAGSGGMYCGSCMRDSAIAHALRNAGHPVSLIPLYTPLRNERDIGTTGEVFYGGVNVYLQQVNKLFRKTPRVLDWVFDRPWLLNAAGRLGAQTDPAELADVTVEILRGEEGGAAKELHRLTDFLRDTIKPQVIVLPNLMFVGMAREFRERVGVPVVCELTGEDIFLDQMKPADRARIRDIIRARAKDVDRFVATSKFYAGKSAEYLGVDAGEIDVVYTGLSAEYFAPPATPAAANGAKRPPTVGYVARQCPEKGLGLLVEAMTLLRGMPNMRDVRLAVAGYAGSRDAKWIAALKRRAAAANLTERIDWRGEVSADAKIKLLDSIDVFTVPTTMPEPKGIPVLEAMARGVPVVQPAHGSFPELLEMTGGGTLVKPNDATALAEGLAAVLRDDRRRKALGAAGQAAVRDRFTERRMAYDMLDVFEATIDRGARAAVATAGAT
jgi:glycosyltransferase involved in cell wall biosynthesis